MGRHWKHCNCGMTIEIFFSKTTSLVRFERGVEPGLDQLCAVCMVGVERAREIRTDATVACISETPRVKVTESEEDGTGDQVLENSLASCVPHIDSVTRWRWE